MGKRSEMSVGKHAEVMRHLLHREAIGKRLVHRVEVSEQTLYRRREAFIRAEQGAFNNKACQSGLQAELKGKERELAQRV